MVQYPLDNARAITVDIADVDAKKYIYHRLLTEDLKHNCKN